MAYWYSTWDSKSVNREVESQNFPLEVFHPRRYMFSDFLWAGDSLPLDELGLFVGLSRRDNLELLFVGLSRRDNLVRGACSVPLAGLPIKEGSPEALH